MSLGEFSEGGSLFKLVSEFSCVVVSKLEEVVGASNRGRMGHRRVMVIVDEATYDGQIISSLDSRDEVVDEVFWRKNWGVLSSKQSSFVVGEFVQGFSFGIGTEWSR